MTKHHRKLPVVTILVAGAGLTIGAACHKDVPTSNPPPPDQPEAPPPGPITTSNPPAPGVPPAPDAGPTAAPTDASGDAPAADPLPAWDEVESGHPKGATNPPLPLLVVSPDGERCWKEWISPMRPGAEVMVAVKIGGKVLAEGETSEGTEVACPDKAATILQKARDAEQSTEK